MDVDAKGRIWVTEAVNYRNFNNDSTKFLHHPKGDRVMILEDTNGDGKADTSKVFVQDKDLLSPVGLAVIGNKVIVSCSPNLIVYTDENGDDKPDKKEILLTGFWRQGPRPFPACRICRAGWPVVFQLGNAGPHHVQDKSGWTCVPAASTVGGSPYAKKTGQSKKR
jgi:putative membrane-bound dehydrogenase-like protein